MAHVLLLGPDRERAAGIRGLLRQDAHQVTWLRSERSWDERERELQPDLVIAAVESPERLLDEGSRGARGFAPPLLFVQQDTDFFTDMHLQDRLVDRLTSPFMGEELLGRADALIRVRRVVLEGRRFLARTARSERQPEPSPGLRGMSQRLSVWLRRRLPQSERPQGPYLEVAARVAEWADRRDAFEPGHAERVTQFCAMVAEVLSMEEQETSALLRAAMLHDIGKVALPVEMLHQKQPLEDSQRRLIQTHPARGAALLRALDPDEELARVVLYHHECPNGGGYYGKDFESVPRAARVLAVAEAFDAMTSSRFGETLSRRDALSLLESKKGDVYDTESVEALVDSLKPALNSIPLGR